jgi:hypothetical protein
MLLEVVDHPASCLDYWNNTWEIADAIRVRKLKWLVVNVCKCKSLVSANVEFLAHAKMGQTLQYAQGLC